MEQRIKLIWQNSKKSNRIFIQNNEKKKKKMHANAYSINLYWLYTKCWGKERAYKINLKNFQKK